MRVHLIDGTYELFRHFFAVPSHVTRAGQEVAATRGVLASLLGLLEDGATHVGVATDHVIESFRNQLYGGYKTGAGIDPALRSQFELLEESLEAAGFRVWAMVEHEVHHGFGVVRRGGPPRREEHVDADHRRHQQPGDQVRVGLGARLAPFDRVGDDRGDQLAPPVHDGLEESGGDLGVAAPQHRDAGQHPLRPALLPRRPQRPHDEDQVLPQRPAGRLGQGGSAAPVQGEGPPARREAGFPARFRLQGRNRRG